jgi:hypothetical protein
MKRNLFFFSVLFISFFTFGQSIKTVNVTTQGTLKNLISVAESKIVSTLTLTGSIDARDFVFMRDKMEVLSVLDLSLVSIKTYTGTEGTNTGTYTTYGANEIPANAFYDPLLNTYKTTSRV